MEEEPDRLGPAAAKRSPPSVADNSACCSPDDSGRGAQKQIAVAILLLATAADQSLQSLLRSLSILGRRGRERLGSALISPQLGAVLAMAIMVVDRLALVEGCCLSS